MRLVKFANTFRKDEGGTVTVDWVVLSAAIVGLGIALATSLRTGSGQVMQAAANELESASTISTIFP